MSRYVPLQVIQKIQMNPDNIRNICILAHVDHGKTTLADGLISSNGIISNRLAGQIRYMDSLEQEQERGITMKSSSITLFYEDVDCQVVINHDGEKKEETKKKPYIINLIDSPGHIDFSSDVAAAVRLCDAAFLIVDVIEGVCTRTIAVLQQAWDEGVQCIVILNKIDRLFLELKQSPDDIYTHLSNLIGQLNAAQSSIYKAYLMKHSKDNYIDIDEKEEMNYMFSPEKGNVLFASAYQGWCFSLSQFVPYLEKSLPLDLSIPAGNLDSTSSISIESLYTPYLWGNYGYSTKKQQFVPLSNNTSHSNIFVQNILKPIYMLYKQCYAETRNVDKIMGMLDILGIKVTRKVVQVSESDVLIKAIMSQWFPLYKATLGMLVHKCPSPRESQQYKYKYVLPDDILNKITILPPTSTPVPSDDDAHTLLTNKNSFSFAQSLPQRLIYLYSQFITCNNENTSPCLLYIGKVYHVKGQDIQQYEGDRNDDICIYLARVYSGVITTGMDLYSIPNQYNPLVENPTGYQKIESPIQLYLPMGRELVPITSSPAGNIVAISGLDGYIHKYGTLCTDYLCMPLTNMKFQCDPIVKVAIEPKNPAEMDAFLKGIHLLKETDLSIDIQKEKTGEYILYGLGELHLSTCLYNLKELSGIDIQMSPPLIELKETVLTPTTEGKLPTYIYNKNIYFKTSLLSLPASLCNLINQYQKQYDEIYTYITENKKPTSEIYNILKMILKEFRSYDYLVPYIPRIIAFGPQNLGNCILVNNIKESDYVFTFTDQWNMYINRYIDRKCEPYDHINDDNHEDKNIIDTPLPLKEEESEEEDNHGELEKIKEASSSSPVEILLEDNHNEDEEEKEKEDDEEEEEKEEEEDDNEEEEEEDDEEDDEEEDDDDDDEDNDDDDDDEEEDDDDDDEDNDEEEEDNDEEEEEEEEEDDETIHETLSSREVRNLLLSTYDKAITYGWKTAVENGPLVDEPEWGVLYIINDIYISKEYINKYTDIYNTLYDENGQKKDTNNIIKGKNNNEDDDDEEENSNFKILETDEMIELSIQQLSAVSIKKYVLSRLFRRCPLGLMLISFKNIFRNVCRRGPMRIVEPLYKCILQCNTNQLGKLYTVIGKRKGKVIDEDIWEGTDIFTITCLIPEIESIGIADDLRRETSGAVNHPQLFFDSWSICEENPYYKPTTKEEIEEWGDMINTKNRSRKIVDEVRTRKGLDIDEIIVMTDDK